MMPARNGQLLNRQRSTVYHVGYLPSDIVKNRQTIT